MSGRPPDDTADGNGDLPREYAPVRSVDTGAVVLIAAGDSRIALASVSGGISVLAADAADGTQFGVEGRPRGLAVGSLVYVAVDDRVFGYGFDGSRRWETDLDGVTALCWIPESSRVVAATDAGEFVLLDAADGTERGRIDRAHADVSEDVLLAGRDGEFTTGESWYLTGFGADGDRRGEAMLDGTITGVGLLDDVAVVSLHGDRVVGVDADGGTTRWERSLGVEWLAQRGDGGIYAATDRGIVRITADGDVTDAGVVAGGSEQVAITTDGGLACRIDGRTAEILRPRASLAGVELDVTDGSLRVGEDLAVAVENRGGPTAGTVRVSGEGASFRPGSRQVRVDAGERADLAFTLADAADSQVTARATFDPEDDGDPAETRATLSVPASTPTPVLEARTVGVEDGAATVEATVRMPDGSDLPAVSLAPGNVEVDPRPGQPSASRTLPLPLGTDRLTATTGDGESVDTALSLPRAPLSASVEARDDGFVDVTIENTTEVPVDDDLRVTGDLLPSPTERSVSLDPGERLTLALPGVRADTGEIRVDAAAVETTATVSLDRAAFPAAGQTTPGGRDDPRGGGQSGTRDAGADASQRAPRDVPSTSPDRDTAAADPDRTSAGSDGHRVGRESDAADDRSPGRETRPAAADDTATGGDDTRRDRSGSAAAGRESTSGEARTSQSDTDSGSHPTDDTDSRGGPDTGSHSSDTPTPSTPGPADQTADSAAPGPDDPSPDPSGPTISPADSEERATPPSRDPIDLARELESDTAHEGYALEETLTVENRSPEPQSVTLRSDGDGTTVELRPEESATATRYHAAWDGASVEVPAVTARIDGSEATVPAASIPLEDAPVVVRPALSVRSDTTDVRLDVRNNLETSCAVLEIGSKGFSSSVGFDDFAVDPGGEDSRKTTYQGTPAERPALTFVRIDRRQRPLQTLASVHESAAPPVSVAVDAVDILDERDTNVLVRVRNDGGTPLDVRIEATGTAPDEYLYSPEAFEGLDPEASATHRIECTVDDDHIELPVELETTPVDGAGDPQSTTVTVSGDRTADAESWQVDADAETPTLPTTLSTPLDVRSTE